MARSGQVTITTAGTAVQGPDEQCNRVSLKALSGNLGPVYVGNDDSGDVTSANGYQLSANDNVVLCVINLNELRFDSAMSGDKVCWIKID